MAAILMLAGLIINNGYVPFESVHLGSVGESLMILSLAYFIWQEGRKKPPFKPSY
jgi:hypothetical protein